MDFYLITGFLGAGKTTFLKNFIRLLAPKRIFLIINEFGKEGVDGQLLREMNSVLAEINNGSIFCACRLDKFEDTLKTALVQKPDVIVTEASGLADPTNVSHVLSQYPEINYKGSICLADSVQLPRVYHTAVVSQKQLAVASLVLLNKMDKATDDQLEATRGLIQQTNPAAYIKQTEFGHIEPEWLDLLTPVPDFERVSERRDITLQKAIIEVSSDMNSETMLHCLKQLSESTYRMKGFLQLADGIFYADCTGPEVQLKPWQGEASNRLVLLAGKGMPLRKAIKQALSWYDKYLTLVKEGEQDG